jgi:UDP-N-acetylmuramoyl-tripeptide--D-alanyl-D-alanine ligase
MIIEMGANHVGEISALCRIAKPTAGLITNIGRAHLEGFASFEGVIKAKSELFDYLAQTGGSIIYNNSNSLLQSIAVRLNAKSVPYSKPDRVLKQGNVRQEGSLTMELFYDNRPYLVKSALAGVHNSENIMAALAVGLIYGVDLEDAIRAIEGYRPRNNRSQILDTDSNTLLCDAYNANPDSMSLAISSFIESTRKNKVIIAGDMLELGSYAIEEHKAVIERLSKIPDIDVYLVGSIFCRLANGKGLKSYCNTELLISDLKRNPIKDSFVLIKGSRAIGLERIYDYL